ncbi:hypothetical protein [Nesterenkonia rhizosphaerae]|uniref:Uncharacterized protein n=1 Tax=Nesterenkonia rhizosphaerae TaxID=1348272 RepID=A0ABP9FZX7_9MICC
MHSTIRPQTLTAGLLIVGLALTACGGDDPAQSAEPAENIASQQDEIQAAANPTPTDEDIFTKHGIHDDLRSKQNLATDLETAENIHVFEDGRVVFYTIGDTDFPEWRVNGAGDFSDVDFSQNWNERDDAFLFSSEWETWRSFDSVAYAMPDAQPLGEVVAGPGLDENYDPTGDFVIPVPVFGFETNYSGDGGDSLPFIEDAWLENPAGERITLERFHSGVVAAGWAPSEMHVGETVAPSLSAPLAPETQEAIDGNTLLNLKQHPVGFIVDPDLIAENAEAPLTLALRFVDESETRTATPFSFQASAAEYDGSCVKELITMLEESGASFAMPNFADLDISNGLGYTSSRAGTVSCR